MAKGIYFGVNGVARKVKKIYFGVNGVACKVKKIYFGVNGVARLAWASSVPAGYIVFTSSQVWTVPDGITKIDLFCVGGGGSGGSASSQFSDYDAMAAAGGGGYTKSAFNIAVTPRQSLSITIGAGGITPEPVGNSYERKSSNGVAGGMSSVGSLCSANGGLGGIAGNSNTAYNGGNGGSGGAAAGLIYNSGFYYPVSGVGGKDGADSSGTVNGSNIPSYYNAKGQGTTTRAFAEASNTLYSSGGNSGAGIGTAPSGAANTGNGGSGLASYMYQSDTAIGGNGGSGIVIIRWAEQ